MVANAGSLDLVVELFLDVPKPLKHRDLVLNLAKKHDVTPSVAARIINSFAKIGAQEVSRTGKFSIPGIVTIKTRPKPATKACNKQVFGKMCEVKARPARTIVHASMNRQFSQKIRE